MTVYCQPWLSEVSRICFSVLHPIRVDYNMVSCMWLTLSGIFDSSCDKRLHLCDSIVEKILYTTG